MSKRSKSSKKTSIRRDITIANNTSLLSDLNVLSPEPLTEVSDNRRLVPLQRVLKVPKTIKAKSAKIKAKVKPWSLSVSFGLPKDAVVCVRRKIRKEVLHALKKAGKFGRRKKPKFNYNSKYRC